MNKKTKYVLLTLGLLNFTVAGISDAAAYLDPGTGSILFQGFIATVASAVAVIVTARQAVARFFSRLFKGSAFKGNAVERSTLERDTVGHDDAGRGDEHAVDKD